MNSNIAPLRKNRYSLVQPLLQNVTFSCCLVGGNFLGYLPVFVTACMASFVTPIQLLCGDHAFDSRSVELKLDGVTLEMSAADVLLVRKANNGVVTEPTLALLSICLAA